MTIAPWGAAEDVTRACFRSLRTWRDRWAAAHPNLKLDVLSMGMSGDFALAIAEGATRIRIGTALFGARKPQAERRSRTDSMMLRAAADGVTLAVRAQPGAKKTAIVGHFWRGAAAQLKIAVQAPPLEGRANEALIAFLAETFGVAEERSGVGVGRVFAEQSLSAARRDDGASNGGAGAEDGCSRLN